MALIRVPHSQPVYGGARTFRGDKRKKPAYVRTEQFQAPNTGKKTYVRAYDERHREKR